MRLIPLVIAMLITAAASSAAEDRIRFNRDIRPILSENCFLCHGPDEEARESDLRLDDEQGAKEYAIVEGDAEDSALIDRISSDDPDLLMPPPDSERALSAEQIELLREWIEQGADYEGHWSFIPPRRPALPDSVSRDLHPIDQFIRARLLEHGLTPAVAADRETLIRRAAFDLTGLPPTLEEIDEFLADDSPDSYEQLLDRLLSRQSFGERMASNWLDAARYSDTYGYQVDRDRFVWPWRDWVIDAINANMPYDRFITLQLAGDLVPNATRNDMLATTFNRLHPQKVEGGSTPEEFRIEYVADRTQTVATALMGLTFECCRCHNHKYDPISQKEYYQLSAFFDNIDEAGLYSFFTPAVPTPTLALPTDDQQRSLERMSREVAALEGDLHKTLTRRAKSVARQPDSELVAAPQDLFAKPVESLEFESDPPGANAVVEGIDGNAFRLTGDDAVPTKAGNFTRAQPFSVSIWIKTPDVKDRAVIFHRSRAWTDAASRGYQLLLEDGKLSWSLIHFWPGNAIRVRAVRPIPTDQWVHVAVVSDGSSRADGLRIFVDGRPEPTETVRDALTKQITGGGGDSIAIGERFRDRGFKNGCVDRFRVFDCELTGLEIERLASRSEQLSWLDAASWTAEQRDRIVAHNLRRHDKVVAEARSRLQQARVELCQVQDETAEIMVMRELPEKRSTYLLIRGAYDHREAAVEPATPGALNEFPEAAPRNRLGLARWLCDSEPIHPLTSRVAVNRLWQLCFGKGLVRTPEDFGSQGEPPTHPDLLDWLAVDFVDSGWDVKRMLKQIMMTRVYRQSSRPRDAKLTEVDPTNRWLARFPSYRLPAEMLRDNALAVSGRLVSTIGGPPAKPYELEASFKPSKRDQGSGLYRRSLYTYWKRTGPAPAMMALDAAKRDVCRVARERTTSPLQALVLLNGPQFIEAARGLAERLLAEHGADEPAVERTIQDAFRLLTSRCADEQEIAVLGDLYQQQLSYFDQHADRIDSFLSVGEAVRDKSLDAQRVAAMSVVIGTMFNFDQSMMKR